MTFKIAMNQTVELLKRAKYFHNGGHLQPEYRRRGAPFFGQGILRVFLELVTMHVWELSVENEKLTAQRDQLQNDLRIALTQRDEAAHQLQTIGRKAFWAAGSTK